MSVRKMLRVGVRCLGMRNLFRMKTITCIGHITRDLIITPESEVSMPGGTTYYFSYGINALLKSSPEMAKAVNYRLVASLGEDDMQVVDAMREVGIDVSVVPSKQTVFFENIYGEDRNNRKQVVRQKADPFTLDSVKDIQSDYIVLGSLLADDFSLEVVEYLHNRGMIVMDAQGYLRKVVGTDVIPCQWEQKEEFFKYIDILKLNEHEAEVLTGEKDLHKAAMALHKQGIKEVLLTLGDKGSIVVAEGQLWDIPAVPEKQTIDTTGCGDTYVFAYVLRRAMGDSPSESALFASAVATVKLEAFGPFSSMLSDVKQRLSDSSL